MMKFSTKVKAIRNGMDFTHGVRRALVGALMLVYLISLGFDVVAVTTLFAVSTLVMTFFEFPTGAIADYDSRKKSLMISFFLIAVSFLGVFLFRSFWVIAGFWILQDIAWTFSTGAGTAWAVDALNYAKKKSKIISLIAHGYAFEKFGHVVGGLIGLIIVAISFRFVWLAISLAYFVLLFIVWKYMEERNFKPEKVPHNYMMKAFIKAKESILYILHKDNKDLKILVWTEVLLTIGFSGFYIGVPLLFVQNLGLAPEYLAGLYSAVAILTIAGPLIAKKVANKHMFGKSLFGLLFVVAVSVMAFAASGSIAFAVFTFAIIKISEAIFDTVIISARQHKYDSKIRASLGSLISLVWAISNSVGVFLTGFGIKYLGVINTLMISGVVMFLTAFVFLWLKE